MDNSNFSNKLYYFKLDHFYLLLSALFFIFFTIGIYDSQININKIDPNISAFQYLSLWFIISILILIEMFVISMIKNDSMYLGFLLVALFFISISIPLVEPFGRTYDSYKFLGYADAYALNDKIVGPLNDYLTYSSWPGVMIQGSNLLKMFNLSPISLENSILFVKCYYILNIIIFILGYFILAKYVTNSRILALKSSAVVILLQTLYTFEFSPNTSTFAMTPILIYSYLRAQKEYKWVISSIVITVFIIVSHPFNVIIIIGCLVSLWLGAIVLKIVYKFKSPYSTIKDEYFNSKKIILIILFIVVGYLLYSVYFGEFIIRAVIDALEKATAGASGIGTSRSLLNSPAELSRRYIFLLLVLFSFYICFLKLRKLKSNNDKVQNGIFMFSVSSLIIGGCVILVSFLSFLTSAYGLYGRAYGFFILIGVIPCVYFIYLEIKSIIKGKTRGECIKTAIIICLLVSLPISYYLASFTNEHYFAPSNSSMNAGGFVGEKNLEDVYIVDNIFPRSIYCNKEHLSSVTISTPHNMSIPPDYFILTKGRSDSRETDYRRFLTYAEVNHYHKVYDTSSSQVYVRAIP